MQVQKKGAPTEIGHSRGGASTKIHAVVDAYGNPVHLMINEGQRNDIVYAIPLLEQVKNSTNINIRKEHNDRFDSKKAALVALKPDLKVSLIPSDFALNCRIKYCKSNETISFEK